MMNLGDSDTRSLSSNYYSNAWNDNIYYTGDVSGSHQYFNDSVCYREDDDGKCNMETRQKFPKFANSFEPVNHWPTNLCVTSFGHFQNQNVPTAKDQNQFEDLMHLRLQQNSASSSMQFSEQISLSEYSKRSLNSYFQNQYKNCCNEFSKFNTLQNRNEVIPFYSGENDFYPAQTAGIQSCSYEENISNAHSLLYGHKSHAPGMNSELEFGQFYNNTNDRRPFYENSTKIQHSIRPTKKPILSEVEELNFNIHPRVQMDKNENISSSSVDPYNNHWYVFGMGIMKMECWEVIVFCRNHSVYVNPGLISQSIGLSTLLVKRLVRSNAISDRMTQLEVSVLKYIKCLSEKSHDTGLLPLVYFLNTIYSKLSKNKPRQVHIKSIIRTFIEKLQSGFVPAVSNIPYDLTSFSHFNKTPTQQVSSDDSFKQLKIVSLLILKNKPFSLIEYNGDFYMHLGEMVSNGLFPSTNLVRRKIRKMHLETKWLTSLESKYLNLSQEQELIRFSDLRILCGLILYLHPRMKTDLLQMFSIMDLPDHISAASTTNNNNDHHLEPATNTQNYFPIGNTVRKELQYYALRQNSPSSTANNQNQFLWADPPQTSPTMIGEYPQIEVISSPCMKNTQSVDINVKMENPVQKDDFMIRNDNPSSIIKENISSIAEREKSVLQEENIEPSTNLQLGEPIFMDSVMNSKPKKDILDVAYQELLDGTADICPSSAIASSQILPRSDESTNRDNCMTPKTSWQDLNQCDFTCNKQDKPFDCYPTSISENFQIDKGNDKLLNYYINQNCNYVEESSSKSVFQIPEVIQKTSTFNNNSTSDKVSQIEQFIDLTANTTFTNKVPVSSNNFGSHSTAEHSRPETFAHSAINTSTDNDRLVKKQTDPGKGSLFLNASKSLDGSIVDPFKSKYSAFDQNTTVRSNILSPPASGNDNRYETSTSSVISNGSQECNFLNTGNEDKFLYTLPQITLPTQNGEENGTRSFEEQEKNYPLTMPFSKKPYFSSKCSQVKIFRNQDGAFQDDLPSMMHCEMEQVPTHNSGSENNCLRSLSDGQMTMASVPFQSLQINGFPFQPMPGLLEKTENVSYQTAISSGNESLDSTSSDCESMLIFSENLQKNVPAVEDVTSAQIISCSETLIPVKNNTLLLTSKENGSSLFPDTSNYESNKEFSNSSRFSEDYPKTPTFATIPNALITCLSSTNTISSPTTTFSQHTLSSPGILQTNQSSTNPKNLDQSIRDENLSKSREIALNSQTPKSGITLEKSQIYKPSIFQPNEPCIVSKVIQRSYKEQTLKKLLYEKPVETDDQTESRSSQVISNIQNHTLEIASLEAIKKLVLETNAFSDSVSQNVKTDNCRLTLPCFKTVDTCRVSFKETNDSSESTVKEFKYDSTDACVLSNSANKDIPVEFANLNEPNSPSLISKAAATKQHNIDSLSDSNNQFPKEKSDRICLNRQNYQHSVASHKQKDKMEPDVVTSCLKVIEKKGQLVGADSTRLKKLEGQKNLVQNKDNYTFSLSDKLKMKPVSLNDVSNIESAVLDKYKKQFDSCSQTTIRTGSLKSASSSAETKSQNICEYNFCDPENLDILSSSPSYQATTAKPISVLDLVNIIKLNLSGNRLHLDVTITDQARRIFENKTKDNPVAPKKIFLQELANDCCQFAKYWFSLHSAKKTLDNESINCANSTCIVSNLKTQTVLPFEKNKSTNYGYPYNTRECTKMPSLFDSALISCQCSRKLCDVSEIPENETPKKHRTDLKGKISQTHIIHDVIEESSSHESNQSNLISFKKVKRQHNSCNDSSKFCEIECIEQMPQKKAKYFGLRSKSMKKIPCLKTKQLKKTKY